MDATFDLLAVRRKSGGRIHLTAAIPAGGSLTTLCDQVLKDGAFRAADAEADCTRCLKRKADPARVSSALFEAGRGESLLELSLTAALERRRLQPRQPAPGGPKAPVRPPQPPARPPQPPALHRRPAKPAAALPPESRAEPEPPGIPGLKRVFDHVYHSPKGVVIRVSGAEGDWQVEEIQHEGPVLMRRRPDGSFSLEVGDVHVQYSPADGRLRAAFVN